MKANRHLIFLSALLLGFGGCSTREEASSVPFGNVMFVIDTAVSGTDSALRDGMLGNARLYTAKTPSSLSPLGSYGYSGVIVVRAYDNMLYAFDACCPHECRKDVAVTLDGYFAVCPQCGSNFEIGNGSAIPSKGPATERLKAYRVSDYGNSRYRIFN
ncbi:MAG: hypothetical protein J5808_00220 [Paludibacteraceae bacterium]|nr:hypothetical protein [Paludibacteraceae bacterium]